MQGRDYLQLAREIVVGGTEVHWRGAAGRAYYALTLEGREALYRWGFALRPRENFHTFVGMRFSYPSHADVKRIGDKLRWSSRLRNQADYELAAVPAFASDTTAQQAIQDVTAAINLLDGIDGDPARRAAAVAAIRVAFP